MKNFKTVAKLIEIKYKCRALASTCPEGLRPYYRARFSFFQRKIERISKRKNQLILFENPEKTGDLL